ncbi:MAG: hypothetical protein K8T89_04250, partial [Planctomycetes bacterium]|nr:hypothetical protein [Planctomycetota bacterium]
AVAFRNLDRMLDALAVSRTALSLSKGDTSLPDHQVFVALEEAIEGKTEVAASLLKHVDTEDLDDVPRLLYAFAETLIEVQQAPPAARAAVFKAAKKKVEDALASFAPKQPIADLTISYRRWTAAISLAAGGLQAWAWGIWKKFRPSV